MSPLVATAQTCETTHTCESAQVGTMICRCLQITEEKLSDAVERHQITTLRDVILCTGAGDGCTCCHARIRAFLEQRGRV